MRLGAMLQTDLTICQYYVYHLTTRGLA